MGAWEPDSRPHATLSPPYWGDSWRLAPSRVLVLDVSAPPREDQLLCSGQGSSPDFVDTCAQALCCSRSGEGATSDLMGAERQI
jgi:hypothetical protein